MTTKEIEEQKNLINACLERLKDASREKETLKARLEEISKIEETTKNEIRDLEHVAVAEVNAEELFNELNAMDSNPEKIRNANPKFVIGRYPLFGQYTGKGKKIELSKLQEKFAEYLFDFKIFIITKARTYSLLSRYQGSDLIDGKPLYRYLQIIEVTGNASDPFGSHINFGFDENFYKFLKVRIPIALTKTYPNLETAVMNIVKRHENAENV